MKKFDKNPLIVPDKIAIIFTFKILKTKNEIKILIEIVNNERNKNKNIPIIKSFPFNFVLLKVSKLFRTYPNIVPTTIADKLFFTKELSLIKFKI